jgi:two-component system, LytTR family, response regulator
MERLYNVLIIGNHTEIHQSILNLMQKHPDLPLGKVGFAETYDECVNFCKKYAPEIVFANKRVIHEQGIEMLDQCKEIESNIIFITGKDENDNICEKRLDQEHILEPIQDPEVLYSISKVISRHRLGHFYMDQQKVLKGIDSLKEKRLKVSTRDSIEFVNQKDIECIEADGSYSVLYLYPKERKLLISKRIKELMDEVDHPRFMRVHNSWIVNLEYIDKYFGKDNLILTTRGKLIPVSRRNKEELMYRISQYFD